MNDEREDIGKQISGRKRNLIKISAVDDDISFCCGHCGTQTLLTGEFTTRGFARHLNKFKEDHEWKCFYEARDKRIIAYTNKIMGDLLFRMVKTKG